MSKSAVRMKFSKKVTEKVIHPPFLKTNIPAGMANPSPPLGPQLGQVSVKYNFFQSFRYLASIVTCFRCEKNILVQICKKNFNESKKKIIIS